MKITLRRSEFRESIDHAQYSVDAGEWQVVLPVGQLSDAPKESYRIDLPNVAPGEHTIAVQVSDRFDNTTAQKVTFIVPVTRAAK